MPNRIGEPGVRKRRRSRAARSRELCSDLRTAWNLPDPDRRALQGTSDMTDSNHLDPTDAFAELGRMKLSEVDLDGVLNKVAELAERTIGAVDEASVTLIRGTDAYTAAHTGDLALNLDE
jgi:hypothetical protein